MDSLRGKLIAIAMLCVLPALVAAEPRGYRNHNPGNIVATDIPWKGKVVCTNGETVHECFENDFYGLRAMALTLRSYMTTHGLTTIEAIMRRFSEFTGAGVAVSRISGIPITEELDVRNLETMVALMQAIVIQENGYTRYDNPDIIGVLYYAYGADHFTSGDSAVRSPKDMGHEAAGRAGKAQHDDAGPWCQDGRASGNPREHGQGLHMDTAADSTVNSSSSGGAPQSSRDPVPVSASNGWVDRVKSGILAIQRKLGTTRLARCERTSDNPAGHAPSGGYCWTLFWW